ncbi:MAG: RimK/LysX family protein [Pseudomonadota bacterium]
MAKKDAGQSATGKVANATPARRASKTVQPSAVIGWREWVVFPDLGSACVKAKIDTGAKTSAIHAHRIREVRGADGRACVAFELHPLQKKALPSIACLAPIADRRTVRNSGGREESRFFIRTAVMIGAYAFEIDLSLTRRDAMGFRMLLGRDAVKRQFLVDAARSFIHGRPE